MKNKLFVTFLSLMLGIFSSVLLPAGFQGDLHEAFDALDASTGDNFDKREDDVVCLIQAGGVDVHRPSQRGMIPLWRAIGHDSKPIVRALLTANADVNAEDGAGVTAIGQAAGSGSFGIVQELLRGGANPDSLMQWALEHADQAGSGQYYRLARARGARVGGVIQSMHNVGALD